MKAELGGARLEVDEKVSQESFEIDGREPVAPGAGFDAGEIGSCSPAGSGAGARSSRPRGTAGLSLDRCAYSGDRASPQTIEKRPERSDGLLNS